MRIPPVPSSIWVSELRLICLRRRLADSLKISKAAAGSKRRKLTEYRGSNALSFLVSGPVRRLARRVPNRDSDKVRPASSWLPHAAWRAANLSSWGSRGRPRRSLKNHPRQSPTICLSYTSFPVFSNPTATVEVVGNTGKLSLKRLASAVQLRPWPPFNLFCFQSITDH